MRDSELPARTVLSVSEIIARGLDDPDDVLELISDLTQVSELQQARVKAAREGGPALSTATSALEDFIDELFDHWAWRMSEIELSQLLRMSLYEAELGHGAEWQELLQALKPTT